MEMVNFSITFKCLYETPRDERQFSRKKFHVRFRVSISKTIIAFIALRRLRIMKFPVRFLIGRFQIIKQEKKRKTNLLIFESSTFIHLPLKHLGNQNRYIFIYKELAEVLRIKKVRSHCERQKWKWSRKGISIGEVNKRGNCEGPQSHTSWKTCHLGRSMHRLDIEICTVW